MTSPGSGGDAALAAVVETSRGDYKVLADRGLLGRLGPEMREAGLGGRAFIVADAALYPAGARRVQDALESAGFPAHVLALASGEGTKNMDVARRVYGWLSGLRAERIDAVIALGGGMIGDLAGFVAATWLRGVPLVQVPTSLAAMVDACLGGKTAVNLPEGKNLVGAFYQPRLVLADIDFLDTLPERELIAGWAEAIKHGLILDAELLATFEEHADEMMAMKGDVPVAAIRRSMRIKAEVVSVDEFETGQTRILLNYGHTVGHALEAVTGYGRFLHGEAVSIGMTAAVHIAHRLGMVDAGLVERQRAVLERFGLPSSAHAVSPDEVLEATRSDKKSRGGTILWVLLEGPGRAVIRRDVPEKLVREAVAEIVEPGAGIERSACYRPPATAGTMLTSSPLFMTVSRPSSRRTSSLFT